MATHATPHLRTALKPRVGAPRATYDVGTACRHIAISIVAILALFILIALL